MKLKIRLSPHHIDVLDILEENLTEVIVGSESSDREVGRLLHNFLSIILKQSYRDAWYYETESIVSELKLHCVVNNYTFSYLEMNHTVNEVLESTSYRTITRIINEAIANTSKRHYGVASHHLTRDCSRIYMELIDR